MSLKSWYSSLFSKGTYSNTFFFSVNLIFDFSSLPKFEVFGEWFDFCESFSFLLKKVYPIALIYIGGIFISILSILFGLRYVFFYLGLLDFFFTIFGAEGI